MIGSDEGIKLRSTADKVLGATIGNVYGITRGLGVGTEMGSLDDSFYGYNHDKLDGLFFV